MSEVVNDELDWIKLWAARSLQGLILMKKITHRLSHCHHHNHVATKTRPKRCGTERNGAERGTVLARTQTRNAFRVLVPSN